MSKNEFFIKRAKEHKVVAERLEKKAINMAILRGSIFTLLLILFVYFANAREFTYMLVSSSSLLFVFLLVVKSHNKVKKDRNHARFIVEINNEEANRLIGNIGDLKEGAHFMSEAHSYSADLDIFGKQSLFQFINRTSTLLGTKKLAKWLIEPLTNTNEILARQEAVKELAGQIDLCQDFQAHGRHFNDSEANTEAFTTWVGERIKLWNSLKLLRFILPIIFLSTLIFCFVTGVTYYLLMPIALINGFILWRHQKLATDTLESTEKAVSTLKAAQALIYCIEEWPLESVLLKEKISLFKSENMAASLEISTLLKYLQHLQSRNNLLHISFNISLLLDIHWLYKLETWKSKNRKSVEKWFSAIAEIEALISMSGVKFANPEWVFPVPGNNEFEVDAIDLKHPLIFSHRRVGNDFKMTGRGSMVLLTGPNMAGKSTFLRTVATTLIMAKTGMPVCADKFLFDPTVQVFTGMRVHDNLSESVSSFYAELKRIKLLIDLAEKGNKMYFFLDEILKGTNSADRHKGSEALIHQLSKHNVSGFISTHDIELGDMANQLNGLKNYSFESSVVDNEIKFSYKLKPEVCQSFNASDLMRKMGIDI